MAKARGHAGVNTSKEETMHTLQRTHALVIGGGIAGLLAARVLVKHFHHVTLVERDHYPQEPIFRPGVPQGRQVHTLLLRGQQALETLFPGLGKKLLAHGAIAHDYGNESLYYYGGRCPHIPPTLLQGWTSSRLLLEWQIRQELLGYHSLCFKEGYEVMGLVASAEKKQVTGVRIRERTHTPPESREISQITADLVVDASGSSSLAPRWLEELGYDAPKETIVDTLVGYATRFYMPPAQRNDWKLIAIQGTQQSQRGGVLMAIEGNRWMVVLAGTKKDYPSTREEEFLTFARSLPDPTLYEAIKEATPISPIYGYRHTANRIRHFEQLQQYPEQFLVLGDAACCFNPIYGQGMTVAALEALMLDVCLGESSRQQGFAHRFQRKVAHAIATPWQLATAAALPGTKESLTGRVSRWYLEHLISLLPTDQATWLTFLEVIHMLRSPLALMHPRIVAKVLTARKRISSPESRT
ncbi:NAD(P)/FAD-dependent oxidoreductase [Ktedonobacter racemifer]|uniref:FAD dependent oxidoreductase n=1 Tax=Ktedonobacter racemifer DSM 44963 TaxID=485913 RepID=D6TWY0_KTERA|nr:FAD-dependent monooxygenase [Ktedonobacter racemifer]EFH84713.1 FAD dependent oxidoreductase [Ktedonobacter racemifer DSM 44963]